MSTVKWMLYGSVFSLWLPLVSYAAVTINEIAWMGTTNSANDEWFELYNSGAATDITNWRITDGAGFDVTFTEGGTLATGAYAVFERTDDDSAPGTAFAIYTGALPNGGATLQLYDAQGTLVDQVAGGEQWEQIGGDNTTKETAQYTATGWVTAAPTPGLVNTLPTTTVTNDQPATQRNTETVRTSAPVTTVLRSTQTTTAQQALSFVVPTYAYVNQRIDFAPTKQAGAWTHRGHDFWWNFGDGHTSDRRESSHQYRFPGTYVVILEAERSNVTVRARSKITVLPVTLAITLNTDGDIQLHNTAAYEVNVSGFTVAHGTETVVLPPYTIILPNQTITLPGKTSSFDVPPVIVFDTAGSLVTSYQTDVMPPSPAAVVPSVAPVFVEASAQSASTTFAFAPSDKQQSSTNTSSKTVANLPAVPTPQVMVSSVSDQSVTSSRAIMSYLALIGVLAVGALVLLARPRPVMS